MSWWSDILGGTAGAPWVWWALALLLLIALLLALLKALGAFPD